MTWLGPDFTLESMPCWTRATPTDIAKLQQTVQEVLQPVRDVFGPVVVSSWMWWQSGCVPRTGPHSGGGTVDFVTPNADMRTVFAWGVFHLPRAYFGRWIYEPAIPAAPGQEAQGEHIHVSPLADMRAVDGITDSAAYIETAPGSYTPVAGWAGNATPGSVEGVSVSTSGSKAPSWAWAGVALAIGLAVYNGLGGGKGS